MTVYIVLQNDDLDVSVLGVCKSIDKAVELGLKKGTFEAEWEPNYFSEKGELYVEDYSLEIVGKEITK